MLARRCADEASAWLLLELHAPRDGLHLQKVGALMVKRFLNSRLSVVLMLAFYAALGWMYAMEVTK
jgi:hypothetical protein